MELMSYMYIAVTEFDTPALKCIRGKYMYIGVFHDSEHICFRWHFDECFPASKPTIDDSFYEVNCFHDTILAKQDSKLILYMYLLT